MITADADLARAAVDAGLFWRLDRYRERDVLSVRGTGVPQLARLAREATTPFDVSAYANYGIRWVAMARVA